MARDGYEGKKAIELIVLLEQYKLKRIEKNMVQDDDENEVDEIIVLESRILYQVEQERLYLVRREKQNILEMVQERRINSKAPRMYEEEHEYYLSYLDKKINELKTEINEINKEIDSNYRIYYQIN